MIVVFITTESEGGTQLANIAWTNTYEVQGGETIYAVHIDPVFLLEGPLILLEHAGLHEVCHLKNGDLRRIVQKGENLELGAERCVRALVGAERYKEYIRTYRDWMPRTPELQHARAVVISNLATD